MIPNAVPPFDFGLGETADAFSARPVCCMISTRRKLRIWPWALRTTS